MGIDFVGVLSVSGCMGGGCVQSVGGLGELGSIAPAYLSRLVQYKRLESKAAGYIPVICRSCVIKWQEHILNHPV